MPVVTFSYEDFLRLLGYRIEKEDFINKIPYIGCEIERVEGDEISIEVFPNRPDLCSVEGIVRASRAFFDIEHGVKKYEVEESSITTFVEPSVKGVRPHIATALIKNVNLDERAITALMDLQEKLHYGLGRSRKKAAIGVHDFDAVKAPFTYKAVPPKSIKFIPLGCVEEMDLEEILRKHLKGIEYGHLLRGEDKFPIILDSNQNVLSFPPIINGSLTEVTAQTKNIFVEVTGTDMETVKTTLCIVATALAERGGKICLTIVKDGEKTYKYPDLSTTEKIVSVKYASSILGMELNANEIGKCLARMGYDIIDVKENIVRVGIPPWRADILHEIDLVEDIAIGFGFDRFVPSQPRSMTYGKAFDGAKLVENIRLIMIGLGFNEVLTFSLSNKKDEIDKMGLEKEQAVIIENPISEEYACLRQSLLPSIMKVLSRNKHHPLPQKVFEIGYVVNNEAKNELHLAAVKMDAKANFSECKSIVESILKGIGLEVEIEVGSNPAFIEGRTANLLYRGNLLGTFGEIHPRTIQAFGLEYPIIGLEMNLEILRGNSHRSL